MAEHIAESLAPRNPRIKDDKTILDPRIPRKKTQTETENIATYLVNKFQAPQFRPLFLKAAWRLSEGRIMEIVEQAFKSDVTNARAYFIKSVKNEKKYAQG